jgi:hypothetical protein
MAEIVTMLVHRNVHMESLSFRRGGGGESILMDLVAEVRSPHEAELMSNRLYRIVDVLDVGSSARVCAARTPSPRDSEG